jgi:hypothetical protein
MGINILSENGEDMVKKKSYDGVIVAARYTSQGEIDWVRAFERHGFVFLDCVMMKRETLIAHLRDGKRFKTGERITYRGNDFRIKETVHLIEKGVSNVIIAGDAPSSQDSLGNLPII